MGISNKKHSVDWGKVIPLVVIGLGLLAIGLVAFSLLTSNNASEDISVVPVKVNFSAPKLTLYDLNGQQVNIADYRQDILLINNWATWCPPCKYEMPTLEKYYQEHAKQGFLLIGIEAGDPASDVAKFVKEYGISFPVLLDPDSKSMEAFGNDSLPSSYVIDHNGNVVLAWTGPISHAMLEKYVTPLMEQ